MTLSVLVTGAGGFIGAFIARYLALQGHAVIATTRNPVIGIEDNIFGINWLCVNLANEFEVPATVEAVVHCADLIPSRCDDLDILYRNNLFSAINVFEKALIANARTVVFMSSMSVYGDIHDEIVDENTIPNHPNPYGQAKLDSERILTNCVKRGLFSGLSLRLPGTVGRGSHHNFISDAFNQLLSSEYICAKNPNALFNNIVHVNDLALFVNSWILNPRAGFTFSNLCSTKPMQIQDILELMIKISGIKKPINFSNGGKKPFLISSQFCKKLGYKPSTVEESITSFMQDNLIQLI